MDYGIRGKVALVGGSSQGIGRAAAAALAAEGARVVLCARREGPLREAESAIRAANGGDVLAILADLSRPEAIERLLDGIGQRWGEIDILVTNTGGPRPGRFFDLEPSDWDVAYELLLKSALRLIRATLPAMRSRRWGRIIGVTSVSVKEPIENLILSNVFRAGVTALFKTLAREVAADGVTINTVQPGLTDTDRLRELYGEQARRRGVPTEQFMADMARNLPLKRLTQAEELGRAIAFLASEAASAITGSALAVDGGQLRAVF